MTNANKRIQILIMALIMVLSTTLASNVTADPPTEASEFYYGVEYDWNSINPDIENFTGLDLPDIFSEVMGAADDAGFELIIGQIMTGSSNVYVHYTEDITPRTIQDINGQSVDVWSRSTDVTLRHGGLIDGIMLTEWSETTFGSPETKIDIDMTASVQDLLNVDMVFTEYLDDDYNLIGADMEFSMNTETAIGLSLDAELKGGGESIPVDFDFSISLGYAITNSNSEWRLEQPDSVYKDISANQEYFWDCYDCGTLQGDYDGSVDYSISVTGIPTEDIGLDEGEFDIEISDEITKLNQPFDNEMQAEFEYQTGEQLTVDLGNGDGLSTVVETCETCPPGNPIMFIMMGNVLAGASVSFGEEIAEEFSEELTENIGSIFGIESDDESEPYEPNYFYCDNGEQIYEWNVNDGYQNCGDGSDEESLFLQQVWSYQNGNDEVVTNYVASASNEIRQLSNTLMFECDNGDYVPWSHVNDGQYYGNCNDNSDEYDENNPKSFTCSNGMSISFEFLNDGDLDCDTGEDEGIDGLFTLDIVAYDDQGNLLDSDWKYICANDMDNSPSGYQCEISGSTDQFVYDQMTYATNLEYGQQQICLQLSISKVGDNNWPGPNSNLECHNTYIGPYFGDLALHIEDDILNWNAYAYDPENVQDTYMELQVTGPSGTTIISKTVPHSGDNAINDGGEITIYDEGEYCLTASLHHSDNDVMFAQEANCESYESNPEPSERLGTVLEAIAESNIGEVMESFGQNLETRMSDIQPFEEFPYNDGMWAPMWSNQYAAVVGVGVYVMDDDGAYTMVGPQTDDYSANTPVSMSMRYLTGVDASSAADSMEGAEELSAIVDVEQHDLGQITQDLENSGIDTSGLDLELPQVDIDNNDADDNSEVDEKIESDGLLPFVSPVAVLAIIGLAGFVFGNRKNE